MQIIYLLNSQGSSLCTPVILLQDGAMATWSQQLHFQRSMLLDAPPTAGKAKGTEWVTDFVVMSNCNKMVVSTSSRELVFSDVSTQSSKAQYRVNGQCLYSECKVEQLL